MAKTIPVEIRQRLVEAFDQGDTREEIAEMYKVGVASITRFLARRRNTGSLNPSSRPGRTPVLDECADEKIREWIKEQPDLTTEELRQRLESIGYCLKASALCDNLKRLFLSRKKKSVRRRAGSAGSAGSAESVAENGRGDSCPEPGVPG